MALTIKMKCGNHSRYDPERDGEGAIRGGCRECRAMYELYLMWQRILREVRAE